jgi:hypothetical protein
VVDTNDKEFAVSLVISDTNKDVKSVLDTLAKTKATIASMAVHKPTLDDVFLSLTGKQKQTKEAGKK